MLKRLCSRDNSSRLLLLTSFETDLDPYTKDAVTLIGVEHWIDWMQHTVEAEQLRTALLRTRGLDESSAASREHLEPAVKMGSSDLKDASSRRRFALSTTSMTSPR